MHLKPLVFGRTIRIIAGIGALAVVWGVGVQTLTIWGAAGLIFLGVSFLLGGITGNPGCEITAIPNMVLPEEKQVHCA